MLISPEYREQNRELHRQRTDYGISSQRHVAMINDLAQQNGFQSVLDYGCGKGRLGAQLSPLYDWRDYDPAIGGKEAEPGPADFVVCTDVLEHIEPLCLADVLDDLKRVTSKMVFMTVSTRKAKKTLPDGRNAHLIVEPMEWWLPKLTQRFNMALVHGEAHEFLFLGTKQANGKA